MSFNMIVCLYINAIVLLLKTDKKTTYLCSSFHRSIFIWRMLSNGRILSSVTRVLPKGRLASSLTHGLKNRYYSGNILIVCFIIVYTYGIGTIGALGHNDYEDKEFPTVFVYSRHNE